VCFGDSGALTRIAHGKQTRILTGLPSLAAAGGESAIGPSDVALDDGRLLFTVGLGADPAVRAGFPALGQQASGWLLRATGRGGWRQVADIAGFEATANPDGGAPDSNPQSVLPVHRGQLVADAGGNSLVRVSDKGGVSTVATFPDQLVEAPPFLGLPPGTQIPVQAVPTSVTRGPDGAYYVGTLTGFPFVAGAANVYRVVPGQAPTVYASGFTNVIDLSFDWGGSLYVLEIAKNGLASGDQTGALIKVSRGGNQRIVASDGLVHPSGLALRGGYAYVSNCGTCAGTGTVERITLH
jgi:hypothetical protein